MKIIIITIQKPMPQRLGCFIIFVIPERYLVLPKSSQRFMAVKNRFFGLLLSAGLSISEHITGLSVRATTVEISTDMTIVTLN